jgi:DNA-binding transcriptional ArsR family regulator
MAAKMTVPDRLVAHPVRLRLIRALAVSGEPLSPVTLAQQVDATLGTTSYHVRMMADAGVIRPKGQRQVRGAVEHFYELDGRKRPVARLLKALGEAEREVVAARDAVARMVAG